MRECTFRKHAQRDARLGIADQARGITIASACVKAFDKFSAQPVEEAPDQRRCGDLALGHKGKARRQECCEDDPVQVARMVGCDDAGPSRQMLQTVYLQSQTGGHECGTGRKPRTPSTEPQAREAHRQQCAWRHDHDECEPSVKSVGASPESAEVMSHQGREYPWRWVGWQARYEGRM